MRLGMESHAVCRSESKSGFIEAYRAVQIYVRPELPKRKSWLGGLDSNQDSQSQSLESYQLDDLPGVANKVVSVLDG